MKFFQNLFQIKFYINLADQVAILKNLLAIKLNRLVRELSELTAQFAQTQPFVR